MTAFTAGLASRHAPALDLAFAPASGFEPRSFARQAEGGPRHFAPADPDRNPTEGWDPLDPQSTGVDPLAAARAEGHAAGFAQATAEAERDHALVAALADRLANGITFDRERLARQLRQTVLLLVGRLVGEVGVSGELLGRRIEHAVAALGDSIDSAVLRVHPDDVALLDGRLPKTLCAVGDADVARGGFVLESASTIVEDGPDRWLEQLAGAIDRVAPPPC